MIGRRLISIAGACLALGIGAAAAEGVQLAQAPQKITVGALRLSSSGPVFIAEDKGYYREQGLEVEFKIFTAAAQVPVAVVSGDIDFGVTGLTAGFFNLAGKGGITIIGAQSREEKGFQLVAYMVTNKAWDAGFQSLKDFTGKRVGMTTTGSTFHYSLGKLAQKYGFDVKSVSLVQLQSLPNMSAAFKGGQVDAVLAPATTSLSLREDGKVLGWVGDETPWQLGALFTSPKNIAERRPVVEKFVAAYKKAAADYNAAFNQLGTDGKPTQGRNYEEMLALLAKHMQQTPEVAARGLPFVDAGARLDVGDIYNQVAFWKSQGLVDATVDAKTFIDLSFVDGHFNLPK